MRVRERGLCVVALLGSLLAPVSGYPENGPTPVVDEAGKGGPVRAGQTIRGLLEGEKDGGVAGTAPAPVDWTVLVKLGVGAISLALVGAGLVFVYRRWTPGGARSAGAGDLRVAGRVALSPRHLVYLLEVGERQVVVGLSGDRMTSLAVLEEQQARKTAPLPIPRVDPEVAPRRAAGESSRRGVSASDLLPYRRQVSRLREMLRHDGADLLGGTDAT